MIEKTLEYRTLPGLWREYEATERSHAFQAETKLAAQEWQQHLRSDLITLLGAFNVDACELSPQRIETRQEDDFTNRVAGIDGHIRTGSADTFDFHGLVSSSNETDPATDGHALSASFTRLTRNWLVVGGISDLSEHFRVDTGYITRTGITRYTALIGPRFYPQWPWLRRIDGELFLSMTKDKGSGLWETFNHISFLNILKGATLFKIKYARAEDQPGTAAGARRRFGAPGQEEFMRRLPGAGSTPWPIT